MKKTYKIWEKDEVVLLKQLYPAHNVVQILEYFPTRTRISIQRKVAKLKLKKLPMKLGRVARTQIAYLAGFFDGEGCVFIRLDKKKLSCRGNSFIGITLSNTDREVLEYFKNVFGGGSRNVVQRYIPSGSIIHQWTITGDRAYLILRAMYPYLRVKKNEAKVAMDYHEKRLKVNPEKMWVLAIEHKKELIKIREMKKKQDDT